MKSIIVVAMVLMLGGCAGVNQFSPVENYKDVNEKIAESNANRLEGFGVAMAGCGNNAACQVAVGMAFAGNMGVQAFHKPQSWLEYLALILPYGDRIIDRMQGGGSGQGIVVNGKGNTVIGVGNKSTADRSSTLTSSVNPYIYTTNSTVTQDRTEQGGPVNVQGTAPPAETVVVTEQVPFLVPAP